MAEEKGLTVIDEAKRKFELACKDASALQIVNNFGAAFTAVNVIALLREALSDEVMERVFMPLMNTKVGFLTDRNGRPRKNGTVQPLYTIPVVRGAIIDAVSIGLLPTGNQFNIIAERMYPTKEAIRPSSETRRKILHRRIIDKGQTAGLRRCLAKSATRTTEKKTASE